MRHKLGIIAGGSGTDHAGDADPAAGGGGPGAEGCGSLSAGGLRPEANAITDWLEERGCRDGWQLAPTFVAAGAGYRLARSRRGAGGSRRGERAAVAELHRRHRVADERDRGLDHPGLDAGGRGEFSQWTGLQYQVVDVHELLDSTLLMLSGKFPPGITVVKDYDRDLPQIPAHAGELNQVWTNLIDNAVSAMDGDPDRPHGAGRPGVRVRGVRRYRPAQIRSGSSSRSSPPSPWARGPGSAPHQLADRGEQAPRRHRSRVGPRRHPVPGAASGHPARGERMSEDPGDRPEVSPSGTGCVECNVSRGWWVHLRRCTQCGHIGCCDTSPSQHASAHAGIAVSEPSSPAKTGSGNYETEDSFAGPGNRSAGASSARPGRAGAECGCRATGGSTYIRRHGTRRTAQVAVFVDFENLVLGAVKELPHQVDPAPYDVMRLCRRSRAPRVL